MILSFNKIYKKSDFNNCEDCNCKLIFTHRIRDGDFTVHCAICNVVFDIKASYLVFVFIKKPFITINVFEAYYIGGYNVGSVLIANANGFLKNDFNTIDLINKAKKIELLK